MAPPKKATSRKSVAPRKRVLDPERDWPTVGEMEYRIEARSAQDRARVDNKIDSIETTLQKALDRVDKGLMKIDARLDMAETTRKHQHEQGQEQNKILGSETREIKKRLALVEMHTSDFKQAEENLKFLGKVFGFVESMKWFGGLAKKPAFWTICGILGGTGGLGTAAQLWWYHHHPTPRPVVTIRQITTEEPGSTIPPSPVPAQIPATPLPVPTPVMPPGKQHVVRK